MVALIPVVIGWIVWRATGNIIIGAVVASVIEAFLMALAKGDDKKGDDV